MASFKYDTVKAKRTFYTEEKLKNARKNIEKFEWAKKEKEQVIILAEDYLAYGIENLLLYVTQQNLPRSYGVNQMKGCPVCGKEIDKFGNYPYFADTFNKPFKLECPNCHSIFPSNDFDSYYKSGLDEYGRFHYEKANPKFLINELYPEKPADWCVDNGFGWVNPEGIKIKSYSKVYDREKGIVEKETTMGDNRYTFIAYFNHWFIWINSIHYYGAGKNLGKGLVTAAISTFRDAYLYTENDRYAKAGLILLNRVADFYHEFDACVYKWEDNFRHSGGAWGKIVGSIWEEGVVDNFIKAYDAFFPAIDQKACQEINKLPFYKNNPAAPKTPKDIKLNIENNILYEILPEVKNRRIRGNVGMHQGTIALAALVLDNRKYFNECIDFILSTTNTKGLGCGDIYRILINEVDHDGCGNETSVGYNGLWLDGINSIAEFLKGTSKDLYNNAKFRKMFNLNIPYLIADGYSLNIGDTQSAGNPFTTIHEQSLISFFEVSKDVKSAQLLDLIARVQTENGQAGDITRNMFCDCEKIDREIKEIVGVYGQFRSESKNYSGYGISKIEMRNEGDQPKCVWMYYGRNTGHGHRDTLMLGLYAYGVFLNPDHGYPCFADGNHERRCWTVNTISHDTVMVDEHPGRDHIVGIPHHFHTGKYISVMDVEAPLIYEQTSCYRRSSVVVNIDNMTYIVDFFRVAGGNNHRYVFHGAEGKATGSGLNLVKQNGGTYAGKGVEMASSSYDEMHENGFNYLFDVQRDTSVKNSFCVDWKVKDTWHVWEKQRDVHIAITVIDPVDEVVLAKGQPPQNKPGNPKEYTYLIAHNSGENIKSQFTSIIEAYENESNLTKAEAVSIVMEDGTPADYTAKALKVTMKNGRIDYIINSIDGNTYLVDNKIAFRGFLAVISFKDDKMVYHYTNDVSFCKVEEKIIVSEKEAVLGKVIDFTKELTEDNKIIVEFTKHISPDKLTGTFIDIKTDQVRNGFYEIESARILDNGLYELSIGNTTFIRGYIDMMDFEKGYAYNISKGAPFIIAFSNESSLT